MLITSLDNKKIKDVTQLKQKKYRDIENKFIIETENLIKEAYIENRLEEVYILENEQLSFNVNCPVNYVTDKVMDKIKSINTSKVLAIATKKESKEYIGKRYLMLDRISDPGNLGTIIIRAVAFDIDTIIVSEDCCDIYNDKVIRATEGAIFKINILKENLLEAITNLKKLNIPIFGTDVNKGKDVTTINKDKFCIIMGNEGSGIRKEVLKQVTDNIYIKTNTVESLNVAVATSIILYELNK